MPAKNDVRQPDRDELRDLDRAERAAERELDRMTREMEKRRKALYRLHDRARKLRRHMVRERFVDLGEEAARQGIDVMALNDLAADRRATVFDRVLAVLRDELGGTNDATSGRLAPMKGAEEGDSGREVSGADAQSGRRPEPGGSPFANTLRTSTSLALSTSMPIGGADPQLEPK